MLRAGQRWAEIEGSMQADGTFLANRVDIIAAEDQDHMQAMEIRDVIADLDLRRSSMTLPRYTILWNEQAKISDDEKRRIPSAKLDNGMEIKVTGRPRPDGTLLARKLQLRILAAPGAQPQYKQELVGPVEVLDAGSGSLHILKTNIRPMPECQFFALPVPMASPKGACS